MVARFSLTTNHWDNLPDLAVIGYRIIDEKVYFIGSRRPKFKAVIIILLAISQPTLIAPFGIKFLIVRRHIKSAWLPTAVFMTGHCSLQGIINGVISLNQPDFPHFPFWQKLNMVFIRLTKPVSFLDDDMANVLRCLTVIN